MDSGLLAFLGIAAIVIVTPGPDTALTVRNTLGGGRPSGVGTAFGVAAGQAVWTLATSAGIAALLVASSSALATLRLVGAVYLGWLGLSALWSAWRGAGSPGADGPATRGPSLSPPVAFRQGLVSNLANPKMAVFFTSLLPQFAPAGQASFTGLLGLGLVFCLMTLAWLAFYAAMIARAGDTLRRLGVRRAVETVTGLALLGLGARLALDRR
jgi:threonine/homoserine/homoserine lactone efflux protein